MSDHLQNQVLNHLPVHFKQSYDFSRLDGLEDVEAEDACLELGEEESGQSSIVTMYDRHDYCVSDTDHDDDDAGEMFANKLVIDLDLTQSH